MNWIDEPGGEELWQDWEGLFGDVSSTTEGLYSQFIGNETSQVMSLASTLIDEVEAIHNLAGVLFLPTRPVIDIAHQLDLTRRLATERDLDDEDRDYDDDERRDIGVVFEAVTERVTEICDDAGSAYGLVAREVDKTGGPLLASLASLADAAALLAEWSQIYVEAAVGYHNVSGLMPDTFFGGGGLAEMHDWDRAHELRTAIGIETAW